MMSNSFDMTESGSRFAMAVGGLLVSLTAGSYLLGIDHPFGSSRAAVSGVLLIAFSKVWMVTRYFMDIRHAPRGLATIVNLWILVTGGLVIGLSIGL
ncbi:cytochrome C oxidase subunit IV family protein [Mycobacterium arosiense]|uniref:Prokaryotic cytochrome C oxidase subunit IV family protein n=1 Tax=Mycobacterium arosiense ATCC BAA-1401 = DSM 45069 TaxID=1265311 RepID=A0A1W9ZC81_MYCAI|nr:cytochrome C oxidase subunit IV family protein [Mycobacterium arosiense]ORA11424.1 hypothetical protein BST14_18620 [Mycobacterium arosiense ATCC BAA-1401 = DSM 45069]